jgi:DNA-binding MarR family transcriptional regulator
MEKPMMYNTISYLLVQISKEHRNKGNQLLAKHDLHAGQELFLKHVLCRQGITLAELTENLEVTPATVTRMAERLEKKGFICKTRCSSDQRQIRVYLTDKGQNAATEIMEHYWNQLENQMVENLSIEEKILLKRLLMQVLDNICTGGKQLAG